jgi:hypothetical protein
VAAATLDHYPHLRQRAERAGFDRKAIEAEFERANAYLLDYYRDIVPVCSYLDAAGQTFDCVPPEQLPAARTLAHEGRPLAPPAGARSRPAEGPCPPDTVELPRLYLEQVFRLGAPANLFYKAPPPTGGRSGGGPPPAG